MENTITYKVKIRYSRHNKEGELYNNFMHLFFNAVDAPDAISQAEAYMQPIRLQWEILAVSKSDIQLPPRHDRE